MQVPSTVQTSFISEKNFRVCQLPYRYILRYESLQADWQTFLAEADIKEDLRLAWTNRSGGGDFREYYRNISHQHIAKLYEKFESDFLMFGYTLDGYI